jgi:two-component system, OmpR family, KDP operon response regulator KdpE
VSEITPGREARLLVVDDEPQIIRFLRPSLSAAGYAVQVAATGSEALKLAAISSPDVIILDLGLPDLDGKEVIRRLRVHSNVPVIVLSARHREEEKVAALDLGADDYVNKPFAVGELMARIRASLRHRALSVNETTQPLEYHGLKLDQQTRRVTMDEQLVHLTPKEFELLHLLMRNAGRILTHRQILTSVWGPAHAQDTQYLRVFIGQLRQKLESGSVRTRLIETEPSVDYRFNLDLS